MSKTTSWPVTADYEAAKTLGLAVVPVVEVEGLSAAKKRALALADNKIAERSSWNRERLAVELSELSALLIAENLEISITGFAAPEFPQFTENLDEDASDPADVIDAKWLSEKPVSEFGDLWNLGAHRLVCGDARESDALARLMGEPRAAMGFFDLNYSARTRGIADRELADLTSALNAAASVSRDGALHFICIDWRQIGELLEASQRHVRRDARSRCVDEIERPTRLLLSGRPRTNRRI